MTALVIEADDPLDNRIKLGKHSHGIVRILIETKSDSIYVWGRFKLDRDHWPVCGQELPVTIDPAHPKTFEIRWDEVPSIEERAAANDLTLADPVGTRKRTMQKLIDSGVAMGGVTNPDLREVVVSAQATAAEQDDGSLDHFKESMEKAAQEPAPAGKTRAVVLVAASEATLRQETSGDTDSGRSYPDRHGKHQAVLAVNVPGSEPYAVFVREFKHKRGKGAPVGAGLPALVSSSDPSDVEVLWDELLSVKKQSKKTAAEAMQAAQERMTAAQQAASAAPVMPPAPVTPPVPGAANAPQMPANAPQMTPQMRQMMIQQAKTALAAVPPNMRQMMIQQYRMAGIEIDDEGNVSE
jgi:hypothetical protein